MHGAINLNERTGALSATSEQFSMPLTHKFAALYLNFHSATLS